MALGLGLMGSTLQLVGFTLGIYVLYDWNEMEPWTWIFCKFDYLSLSPIAYFTYWYWQMTNGVCCVVQRRSTWWLALTTTLRHIQTGFTPLCTPGCRSVPSRTSWLRKASTKSGLRRWRNTSSSSKSRFKWSMALQLSNLWRKRLSDSRVVFCCQKPWQGKLEWKQLETLCFLSYLN